MKKIIIGLTEELIEAINLACGDQYRQAFLENILRRNPTIKKAARENGINWKPRPERGKWERH